MTYASDCCLSHSHVGMGWWELNFVDFYTHLGFPCERFWHRHSAYGTADP